MPCDDCSRAETCPPCVHGSDEPEYDKCACGHERHEHDINERYCAHEACGCTLFRPEPKGSDDSSPDDVCRCRHQRRAHTTSPGGESCVRCPGDEERTWKHAFVPADAETAGEPECTCGVPGLGDFEGPQGDCPIHGEPEAPEPWPCGDCGAMVPAGQDWCRNCGDVKPEAPGDEGSECPVCEGEPGHCRECGRHNPPKAAPAPPRPPFLVAYATGSGDLIELVLPGSAGVAVVNGALVVTHPSSVLGIQHVKPLEGP